MGRADGNNAVSVTRVGDAECGVALIDSFLGLEVLIAMVAGRRDDDHAAFNQSLAFLAHRCAPAGEIAHIMRNGETEIGAMNGDKAIPLINVADVLKRAHDGKFGILEVRCQHAEIVKPDVRTHAVCVVVTFTIVLIRVLLAGADDSRDVRAMLAGGAAYRVYFHEFLDQLPMNETSALCVFRECLKKSLRIGIFSSLNRSLRSSSLKVFLPYFGIKIVKT